MAYSVFPSQTSISGCRHRSKHVLEHNFALWWDEYDLKSQTEELAMNGKGLTRRQALAGMTAAFGSFAAHAQQTTVAQKPSSVAKATRTSLRQQIELAGAPQRIFDALLDSKQFAAFTGRPAEIDRNVGGAFKTFGGLIEGRNVEIVPAHRIVQAWRPTSWESGVYSLVRFELKPRGRETTLILDHKGFPEGDYGHLYAGWLAHYWEPLKKWLATAS
jgi:uncharacterized protein YndB with AHSA1/START domain